MQKLLKTALAVAGLAIAAQASAQVTVYEREGFQGRSFTTGQQVGNLDRMGFRSRASSVVVAGERWEVCDNLRFSGQCMVLRPGRYPSLAAMGVNDRVSSVRAIPRNARVADSRYAPLPGAVQITVYEREGFQGRSFTTDQQMGNVDRNGGFGNRAASMKVVGAPWEICEDTRFNGRCVVLRPGSYPSIAQVGVSDRVSSLRAIDSRNGPALVTPQVIFYEGENFQGRSMTTQAQLNRLGGTGFNDRASSAEIIGAPWEVCEDPGFNGRCVVLRPGKYPSLVQMGLNNRVSSVRNVRADDVRGNAGVPAPNYAYGRRDGERLYEANVTSVRAVVGTPEQRCWVEREQAQPVRNTNVGGAIAGALIGGILGHQVGGGSGKDLATVGGAVAGGVIGANVGGGSQTTPVQNVQRCNTTPSQARPDYWDVTYNFRGQEHRVQMATPPGNTVVVNEQGEPRV